MAHAVQPVVTEVVEHESEHPGPGLVGGQFNHRQVFDCEGVGDKPHALGQQTGGGRQHAGAQAVDRVCHAVVAHAAPAIGQQLDGDQHEEERHGIQDELHDATRAGKAGR
ncbi:hypothetical protein D3C71_1950970 [compost metagenome]